MIKALFLIFEPASSWDRVVAARRGLGFILGFYLLPMLLIVAVAKGFGLVEWGKWRSFVGTMKVFTVNEAVIYETGQLLLMFLAVVVCAHLIKIMGETFHGRHSYTQAFTVVCYGLSPLFLLQLLDALPKINPYLTWLIGVLFSVGILYQGIPRVMLPDPPHAFGLYMMGSLLIILATGFDCFVTTWYMSGRDPAIDNFISQVAAKLPF
ncbi:MAG: Yip1 family protein [Limisphaerales bacterium]